MKKACEKWSDQLLEAALTGATAQDLEEHLRACTNCSEELSELRARKARLDALLPLTAQAAGPSVDFRARVLAAAEAASEGKSARPWRGWGPGREAAGSLVGLLMVGGADPRISQNATWGTNYAPAG